MVKKSILFLVVFSFLLASCAPSSAEIAAAIAQTQKVENEKANEIQTGIAQTLAAASTNTPIPTNTDIPIVVPPTPTYTSTAEIIPTIAPSTKVPVAPTTAQKLVLNLTIKVRNKCSESHTVIMTGPMRLKYVVGPGQTVEYQAAKGTYSWTIDGVVSPYSPQDLYIAVWTLTLCG